MKHVQHKAKILNMDQIKYINHNRVAFTYQHGCVGNGKHGEIPKIEEISLPRDFIDLLIPYLLMGEQ